MPPAVGPGSLRIITVRGRFERAAVAAFIALVIRRARRQKTYKPVGEDWLWHAILPCAIYAALTLAALFLDPARRIPSFLIGGAALVLLLVGIHNAWDSVTHHVIQDVAKLAKDQ